MPSFSLVNAPFLVGSVAEFQLRAWIWPCDISMSIVIERPGNRSLPPRRKWWRLGSTLGFETFFFTGDADGLSLSLSLFMTIGDLFKDDAQYCSEVAAFLGHMTCWDCCLVLWICPEQMVLDPAQSFDNVDRNVTKLSGESACVGHICFGESCCFPMDETQTCTKCPTCPEQLK